MKNQFKIIEKTPREMYCGIFGGCPAIFKKVNEVKPKILKSSKRKNS